MKKYIILFDLKYFRFFLASAFLYLLIPLKHSQAQVDVDKLSKYIDSCRQEWSIPGMSVAIIKDDKVILLKGFGINEVGKPDSVTPKTMFGIASLTKAFTSASIMQLSEQGKINLEDKVTQHIPYFNMYDPWVTHEMTVRDLLCHCCGLATFSGDLLWHSTVYSREDIIRRVQFLKPVYGFRAGYGYSNLMFLTAGEMIPAITGKSYDAYLQENFFKPLEMNSTNSSIQYMKDASKNKNVAIPHVKKGDKIIPIKYISWDNIAPAGGINSNAEDMTHWLKMLLNNGKYNGQTILTENSLRELWSSQNIQEVSKFDNFLFPSMHFHSYGLGWDLFDYHGRKVMNHSGGLDGMVLHLCVVPEEKLGFVILTNSSNYLPYALMYKILDEFFEKKGQDYPRVLLSYMKRKENIEMQSEIDEENARNKKSSPSLILEKYVGEYCGDLYGCAKVSIKNNKLFLQFEPAPEFQSTLTHWQYNTFSVEFLNFPSLPKGKVNFIIDQNGNVDEFTIDVPNPDFDFTELSFKRNTSNAH
ncbi:MAG: serine hydrolase [Bacteroidetes bacterium HGW-Bacteroidetes-21]|jgi:CubicO group peptidase (beta-lactamase class C family)|nr:MAG: serine hydrolase [Bacteroidetes bacterium HGW-Bacteroidetes-21]